MLPLENLLVRLPPLLTPYNFLSIIMMILTLNIPSWKTTLYVAENRGYFSRFYDVIRCYQSTRLYLSLCSINKRFCYYHGLVRKGWYLRTFFIEHHHFISLCSVDWYVCLFSIHYLTCWTYFWAFFLPDFLIPQCSNPSVRSSWSFYVVLL